MGHPQMLLCRARQVWERIFTRCAVSLPNSLPLPKKPARCRADTLELSSHTASCWLNRAGKVSTLIAWPTAPNLPRTSSPALRLKLTLLSAVTCRICLAPAAQRTVSAAGTAGLSRCCSMLSGCAGLLLDQWPASGVGANMGRRHQSLVQRNRAVQVHDAGCACLLARAVDAATNNS